MQHELLTTDQKEAIRSGLVESARKLLNTPYEFGAEWTNYAVPPKSIDCSELVEGIYTIQKLKMPDGSQMQFDFTITTPSPLPGDLAFFGRGGRPGQIYHVGMVFNDSQIIEARAFDQTSITRGFETGKVILRSILAWTQYRNFVSFSRHPKLL